LPLEHSGFAEHRQLVFEHVDGRIERLRADMTQELTASIGTVRAEMRDRFDAVLGLISSQALKTGARFDRVETKLDAFIDAQSAVNRRLEAKLDAVNRTLLERLP
jgi:hypothetical protein